LKEEVIEWVNPWGDKESAISTRKVKEFIQRLKEEEDEMIRITIKLYPYKSGEELSSEIIERLNNLIRDKLSGFEELK